MGEFHYRIEIDDGETPECINLESSEEENEKETKAIINKDAIGSHVIELRKYIAFMKGRIAEIRKRRPGGRKKREKRVHWPVPDYNGKYPYGPCEYEFPSESSESCFSYVPSDEEVTCRPSNEEVTCGPSNEEATCGPSNEEATCGPSNEEATCGPSNEEATCGPSNEKAACGPSNEEATCGPSNEEAMETNSPEPEVVKPEIIDENQCKSLRLASVKRIFEMTGFTLVDTCIENKMMEHLSDLLDSFLKTFTQKLADNRLNYEDDERELDILEKTLRDFGINGIGGLHEYHTQEICHKHLYLYSKSVHLNDLYHAIRKPRPRKKY